jgi:hypothetical protein
VSNILAKAALETALSGITPALATQWENVPYAPVVGTAYQQVDFVYADTNNPEMGSGHEQSGSMWIRLRYPENVGTASANARAEVIKTTFKRGNTYTSGGLKVKILNTPSIKAGVNIDGRWLVPIEIPFYYQIL